MSEQAGLLEGADEAEVEDTTATPAEETAHGADAAPGGEEKPTASPFLALGEDRPDWVQEQFWDAEKGVNVEALAKSYNESRAALNRQLDEARRMDKAGRPDKPEAYLEDWAPPKGGDDVHLDRIGQLDAEDPAVQAWAKVAHKHGMSRERFNAVMTDFLAGINEHLPEPLNVEAEYERLGGKERATKLAGAVVQQLRGMLNDGEHGLNEAEYKALMRYGARADFVSALSKVLRAGSPHMSPDIPAGGLRTDGVKSPAECHSMMGKKDEQGRILYYQDSAEAAAWREQVDREFARTFGTGSTSSTSRLPAGGGNA